GGLEHIVRGGVLQRADTESAQACLDGFRAVPGLLEVVQTTGMAREVSPGHLAAACELVLEALVADRRISRSESGRYGQAGRRRQGGGGAVGPGGLGGPGGGAWA